MEIKTFFCWTCCDIEASCIPLTHSSGTAVPVQCLKYMPALTRQRAGSMAKMEEFLTSMLAALEDPAVVEHYRLIFEPIFRELLDPVTRKLSETVQALTTKVSSLQVSRRKLASCRFLLTTMSSTAGEIRSASLACRNLLQGLQMTRSSAYEMFAWSFSPPDPGGNFCLSPGRQATWAPWWWHPRPSAVIGEIRHQTSKEPGDGGKEETAQPANTLWWRRQLRCRLTPRSLSGTRWRPPEECLWRRWWTQQQQYELTWW